LEIDNRDAAVGEQIYIPQHPGGRAKELGIYSTASADAGGVCRVYSITQAPCNGTGFYDVGYYCDTEGGSSGSPVLASSNDKVIALHHCAYCPNRGVPIDLVYAEIAPYISGGQEYCSASCESQNFEWIKRVEVGGINNYSGASEYSDFTHISTNVSRGASVSYSLTPGFARSSAEEEWTVFIDYNRDYDFEDSGELVAFGLSWGVLSGSFTVPTSAAVGSTRMRVIMEFYETDREPCGVFPYGEVEDYTVNIQ
jgi:hypothetical protein